YPQSGSKRDRVPLTARFSGGSSSRNRYRGRPKSENAQRDRVAQGQLRETTPCRRTRGGGSDGSLNAAPSLPFLNRNEPTLISKAASISGRTRANAHRGNRRNQCRVRSWI